MGRPCPLCTKPLQRAPEYAQRELALINNPAALAKLRAASLADADVYTLEKMVAQFADGIARCLGR